MVQVDQAYESSSDGPENKYYFSSIIDDLATEEIKKHPEAIVRGRDDYFRVEHFLGTYRRLHFKNICEWVVYFETGKIVEL